MRNGALAAFAFFGAALAAASVLVAGWPLHVLFLNQLLSISQTVLTTGNTYNLNAVIAHYFFNSELLYVSAVGHPLASETISVGWEILPKTALWRGLSTAALLAAIIWAGARIRRDPGIEPTVWMFAFGAMALLGPIGWPYYYIPLLAFLPAIIDRLGSAKGLIILTITLLPSTIALPLILYQVSDQALSPMVLGTAGFTILTIVFALLPGPGRPNS